MVYFHEIHLRRNKTMFISMKSEYVETNPRLFPRKLITTKQIRTYFHENQLRKNKHLLPHKHCEIRSKQLPPLHQSAYTKYSQFKSTPSSPASMDKTLIILYYKGEDWRR